MVELLKPVLSYNCHPSLSCSDEAQSDAVMSLAPVLFWDFPSLLSWDAATVF